MSGQDSQLFIIIKLKLHNGLLFMEKGLVLEKAYSTELWSCLQGVKLAYIFPCLSCQP